MAEVLTEPVAVAGYFAWACSHGDATYLVFVLDDVRGTAAVVRGVRRNWICSVFPCKPWRTCLKAAANRSVWPTCR